MMKTKLVLGLLAVVLLLAACGESKKSAVFEYDFSTETHGWVGDFVDLPTDWDDIYELEFDHRPLPSYLGDRKALYISGSNRSDDLFMFLKKQVTGLKPNAEYRVEFTLRFATQAASGCVGIGGAPGEAVYVKAGAAPEEPVPVIENGWYRLNLDKCNQSGSGEHGIVLGDVANTLDDCHGDTYELKTLQGPSDGSFITRTDANGSLWIFAGTDSGFEGKTSLYYTYIKATLELK
jgi:hypothetical protein